MELIFISRTVNHPFAKIEYPVTQLNIFLLMSGCDCRLSAFVRSALFMLLRFITKVIS